MMDNETLRAMLRRQFEPSVMDRPAGPEWRPEYEQEPPLEAVSPEDFVPSPKALVAALKGVPMALGMVGPRMIRQGAPEMVGKGVPAANDAGAVVETLITNPQRDFHKSFMGSIREKADEAARMAAEYDKWKYGVGDRIKTPSGQVLEVTHRMWQPQTKSRPGRPMYRVTRADVPEGAEGHWLGDARPEILERADHQLMTGPQSILNALRNPPK